CFAKNETKIADMVDVMVKCYQYIPESLDSDPISCILYGDALSCGRANDAQNARINGESKWDRLQGTCFCNTRVVQAWHTIGGRNLKQIINKQIRHHNVNSKTSSCFNYATDLLNQFIDKDNIPNDIEKLWCSFQSIVKK
ncbi:hypothetical protein ACJMK2_031445, partial [Sinanodonta woodiana]